MATHSAPVGEVEKSYFAGIVGHISELVATALIVDARPGHVDAEIACSITGTQSLG